MPLFKVKLNLESERSKAKDKYFEDVVRNIERNRKKETSSSSSSLSPHSSISQKILNTSSIDINKNNPPIEGPPPVLSAMMPCSFKFKPEEQNHFHYHVASLIQSQ